MFPKALQCACDCFLWDILIADPVMKGEKGCMPAVGAALPVQFCPSKFSHPDGDIPSSAFHGRLGRGSTLCVCVFPAGKSQPVRRTGPNPVCVHWKGLWGAHMTIRAVRALIPGREKDSTSNCCK